MFNRNVMQASNPARRWAKTTGGVRRFLPDIVAPATYPEVPPGWPNRATRRAIKQGREHRLDGAWRQVLMARPSLREEIRRL
jgi:hypothetical protein